VAETPQFAPFDPDDESAFARTMDALDMHSALVAAGFQYWNQHRRGRAMPARGDLDPLIEIPALVPSVMLFDVRRDPLDSHPLDFRWRLIGTRVRQNFWKDYTGQWFSTDPRYGDKESSVWKSMETVVLTGRPVLHHPVYVGPHDDFLHVENILLPLSLNGQGCGMEMIFIDFVPKKLRR
jgi:hypothetical protein